MKRFRTWTFGMLGLMMAFSGLLIPVVAQDAAQSDFTPFDELPAQPGGTLPRNPEIQLVRVAEGLIDPVNIANAGDESGRIFVVERTGTIRIIDADGNLLPDPFLDITPLVKIDHQEQGLLGLAFHPNYTENGLFYIYYSDHRTNGDHMLVERRVSEGDSNVADPDYARLLITEDDPFTNHNGGTLRFGPDGYLYLSIGDGGSAGDPYDNAQDLSTILGKIIRIDVDGTSAGEYGIPEDNPFAHGGVIPEPVAGEMAQTGDYRPDARGEIWAFGLRNPWQFSFDGETGDLYITDVGQNRWEEINFQEAGSAGGQNYGWDPMESAHCYPPAVSAGPGTPVPADIAENQCQAWGIPPVAEYNHDDGSCSITGLGVYRGSVSTSLNGIYFAGDYCSGKYFGLARDDAGTWQLQELLHTDLRITGAGEDEAGELYITTCATCGQGGRERNPFENPSGEVWRLVETAQVPEGAVTAPVAGEERDEQEAVPEGQGEATPAAGEAGPSGGAVDAEGEETFVIEAIDIDWDPNELTIPANTNVTIEVPNTGFAYHTFVLPDFDIKLEMASGEEQSVTVNLPPGRYDFICDVPGHEEAGMVGVLIVE